ncbi:MAG: Lrp/AsnC ligand binding domain-containing protein [Bacteroidales bacterium]|nr:Lrp/AsnC ligand binding domain-containing protein [Bacteroidales bacterium]HPO64637.1 Lrp/AsnC ligand binding domain-containing protein [Bacteroidales bacterium]
MEEQIQIDSLDKKILSIIQGNARIPFLEVARECGVSGAAIHQRVQRLMRLGVITGSEFVVDPKKLGFNTCAYIGIYLEKAGLYKEVVAQLKDIPEIVQCDYTTGNYSIFVKVYTRDNLHLKEILADKIQSIRGIARTETFICLEESFVRQLPVL